MQLGRHFNSSEAKQGLDERFKGLSKKTKERCEGITKTIGNLSAEIDTKINRMLQTVVQTAHETLKNDTNATLETIHNSIQGDREEVNDMNTRLHNRFDRLQNEQHIVLTTICGLIKEYRGPSTEFNQILRKRCNGLLPHDIEGHFEALLDHLSDTAKAMAGAKGSVRVNDTSQ